MRDAWRRRKRLAVLSAVALLLHASLLGGTGWSEPASDRAPAGSVAIQVRTLVEVPPALAPEALAPSVSEPAPDPVPTKPRSAVRKALAASVNAPAVARPSAPSDETPPPAPIGAQPRAPLDAQPPAPLEGPPPTQHIALADSLPAAPGAALDKPGTDKPGTDEAVPVYKTRAPPAATLRFRMQRGGLRGTADLAWRPSGGQYELRLDGKLMGLTLISQSSQGGFDAAGLAPVRFTDQRVRGELRATNFQREAGKITFSGPSDQFALWAGVQDRLSWMIQLPAIVAADPRLALPGARVSMHVVGARADAAVWTLRCVDRESVDAADGTTQAVKFVREAHGPYDTGAEIWLDPKRHYLPVRASLRSGSDSDPLELILQEVLAGP